jgi:HK97 gp10 family phage protein
VSNIDAFKAGLNLLGASMADTMPHLLSIEGDRLVKAMQDTASRHKKSGDTVASIRMVKTGNPNRIRIVAGGELTTREIRKGSGVAYDYALAEEFGTKHEAAIPFFWNTYRANKAGIVQRVTAGAARTID